MGAFKHKYKSTVTREEAGEQPVVPFYQLNQAIVRAFDGRRFNRDEDIKEHGLYNKGYDRAWKRANDLFAMAVHQIILKRISVDRWEAEQIWRWKQNSYYGLQQTYFGCLSGEEINIFSNILMEAMDRP